VFRADSYGANRQCQDGKPLAAHTILVSGIKGNADTPNETRRKLIAKHPSADVTLVTDTQGRVRFDFPTAPPANFYVRALLRPPGWDCSSCLVTVRTEVLMRKGLWVGSRDDASIQPQPGEILFRIRPTASWQRVFWPLLVDRPF
jgi:hypothetical protein